jgi:hypothetical protein
MRACVREANRPFPATDVYTIVTEKFLSLPEARCCAVAQTLDRRRTSEKYHNREAIPRNKPNLFSVDIMAKSEESAVIGF